VKNGAALFDRVLRELASEAEAIDVGRFVPLIRAHMASSNPYVRTFLLGWIETLDAIPSADMLSHAAELLEGLFDMLSDGNREGRRAAHAALASFLDELLRAPADDLVARFHAGAMLDVLIAQTARDRDRFARVTAIEWIARFIPHGRARLAPWYARLTATLLACLSDPDTELLNDVVRRRRGGVGGGGGGRQAD
jgi:vacuole morphology and inheritance protein 14